MTTMKRARAPLAACAAMLGFALTLDACDSAPSATAARAHAAGPGAERRLADDAPAGGGRSQDDRAARPAAYGSGEPRREDAPLYHGKPIWAGNRRHSAQENADYHYQRDGQAIGAASEDDFIAKVHAFIDHPPKGAETLTRSNGDKLIYDPGANLFAVADKDGAPRTLFKPRDGQAYWAQQKDQVAKGEDGYSAARRRSARRGDGDDNG